MLPTVWPAGRTAPAERRAALPRRQALGTCDMLVDPSREFFDTHTWLAAETPVDLTGSSGSMLISTASDRPLLRLSSSTASEGGLTLGGVAGTIDVRITKAGIALLSAVRQASYLLSIHFADGTTVGLLQGVIYVNQDGSC
jgi:hypothetical protein